MYVPVNFVKIFKNGYLVVHVRSATSDILEYPYVGISSERSTWNSFVQHVGIHSF